MDEQKFSELNTVIEMRINSLKSNRTFLTALFTIISAILTIFYNNFLSMFNYFWVTFLWLFLSLGTMFLSMYAFTDSIHFYTKYLEYVFCWHDKVHGEIYEEGQEKRAIKDYKRALEADDVGYFFMKYTVLFFAFSLGSIIINFLHSKIQNFIFFICLNIILYVWIIIIIIKIYGWIHHKNFFKALYDFFIRNIIFHISPPRASEKSFS